MLGNTRAEKSLRSVLPHLGNLENWVYIFKTHEIELQYFPTQLKELGQLEFIFNPN